MHTLIFHAGLISRESVSIALFKAVQWYKIKGLQGFMNERDIPDLAEP